MLAALGGLGCSEESTAPPANKPPTISITFSKVAVAKLSSTVINVDVADPDDDPLTVTWSVTRAGSPSGTIVSGQGTPSLEWQSPNTIGEDLIEATVSDGRGGTATASQTVKVGTRSTAAPTTLFKTNSPYIIAPPGQNYTVIGANTLVVEAGVEVYLEIDKIFNIEGTLDVQGTATEPVLFTVNSTTAGVLWNGFQVASQGGSPARVTIAHGAIERARTGVKASTGADVRLTDCVIRFNVEAGVQMTGSAALRVIGCELADNQTDAIKVETVASLPDSIRIAGNLIEFNGQAGGNAAIYVRFSDPGASTPFSITGNNISRNFTPGIVLEDAAFPDIRDNAIFGNTFTTGLSRNIQLWGDSGFGGQPTIDATSNYWILTDKTAIKQTIVDSEDSPSITTEIVVDPWLTTCPSTTFPFEGVCQP